MRVWFCAVLCAAWLFAADQQRLALTRQAEAAFGLVERNAAPPLRDSSACMQAQAAMLAVALPVEQAQLHYRKGFCELANAAITRGPAEFVDAAAELDKGGDSVLAWLARMQVGQGSEPPGPERGRAETPNALSQTARLWVGWIAYKRGDLREAARNFAGLDESGFPAWAAGLRTFQDGKYSEAVSQYRQAIDAWSRTVGAAVPTLAARLAPPVDLPAALTELGGAQLLAGNLTGAISTLDTAMQAGPPTARVYYLRARARELSGRTEPALADYNLASRTAFANAPDLASGEAHLYRGILLYRRRDFARAEDEFASALNFDVPYALRADTAAWRHLSAVVSGFCGASREYLERTLPSVSPYFPKDEAKAAVTGCGSAALQ